ncbi:MAG: translation initiation factor IF-2 subunit alpha [Desulfurococcaceae archaeon]
MVLPRKETPDIGELLIASVQEIYDYGAYVTLDEYNNVKAFLPWSEVSSKWVRNIRDVIREGQKIVVKVIRIDRAKKEIDVSLKRVSDSDKQNKMKWWKRYSKACKIIELAAEKKGARVEDAYREIIWKLEDKHSDIMYALERSVVEGPQILVEAGIPSDWIPLIIDEAARHVKIKKVVVRYKLTTHSTKPDGVLRVKKTLETIAEYIRSRGVKFKLYVSGSPRYLLEVYASDYKTAETVAEEAIRVGFESARELDVIFQAEREKH